MENFKKTKKEFNYYNFNLSKGELILRCEKPDAETETRTTDSGKIVHEKSFDEISGVLSKIDMESFEWKNQKVDTIKVSLKKELGSETTYTIGLNKLSFSAVQLLNRLLNSKVGQPIAIKTYYFKEDKEKKLSAKEIIVVYQKADTDKEFNFKKDSPQKIEPKYAKEDVPEITKTEVNEKTVYDFSKFWKFMQVAIDLRNEELREFFTAQNVEALTNATAPEIAGVTGVKQVDDMPF